MDKFLGNKKAVMIFTLPSLLLFGGILIVSVAFSFYYSTLDWDGIGEGIFIGLDNYVEMFQNAIFDKAVINSFLLCIFTLIIQLPLALILALILASHIKGEVFFRTVFFIPVTLSTVVVGQLWLKIYNPNYGVLNELLRMIGLESLAQNWLGDVNTALFSAFVPIIWQNIGYHMLLLYTAIKAIPKDIHESAEIDGATGVTAAFKITIPLILPTLKTCAIFVITGSLKAFDMIYVLTNGGPVNSTEVPSSVMFNSIFVINRYGYGSAIAIFIVVECILIAYLLQRLVKTSPIEY
mgnify:FL=1